MTDLLAAQRTAANGAAVVAFADRGVIRVTGPDRLTWLHSLTTQHLEKVTPFAGTDALVLSPHGHVEHFLGLYADEESVWIDSATVKPLWEYLDRMVFWSEVEPVVTDHVVAAIFGPDTSAALAVLGVSALASPDVLIPPPPKFAAGAVPGRPSSVYAVAALPGGGVVRRTGGPGGDGAELILPPDGDALDKLAAAGFPPVELAVYDALRVADWAPRWGADLDHKTLPHELDWLRTAVHLEKGCYRGQETVSRVHHLGRAPRRQVLLQLDGVSEDLPAPGDAVMLGDRRIGQLGTVARHYESGAMALAMIKSNTPDDAQLMVGTAAAAIDPKG